MNKNKMFQLMISIALAAVLFISVVGVTSADGTVECIGNYGQKTICGTTPQEFHPPVQAGLGDINIGVVGGAMLLVSTITYIRSKRAASTTS